MEFIQDSICKDYIKWEQSGDNMREYENNKIKILKSEIKNMEEILKIKDNENKSLSMELIEIRNFDGSTKQEEKKIINKENSEIRNLKSQIRILEEAIKDKEYQGRECLEQVKILAAEYEREKSINTILINKEVSIIKNRETDCLSKSGVLNSQYSKECEYNPDEDNGRGEREEFNEMMNLDITGYSNYDDTYVEDQKEIILGINGINNINKIDRSNQKEQGSINKNKIDEETIIKEDEDHNVNVDEQNEICEQEFRKGPGGCKMRHDCKKKHMLNFNRIRRGLCYLEFDQIGSCKRENNCWFTHEIPDIVRQDEAVIVKFKRWKGMIKEKKGRRTPERGEKEHKLPRDNNKKITVFGDSLVKRINRGELSKRIKNGRAIVKPFPGANANELKHYVLPTLMEHSPDIVIIHVGSNNISRTRRNAKEQRNIDIVKDIMKTGLTCREKGVKEVFISSLLCRSGMEEMNKVNEINNLLKQRCAIENFGFICNEAISENHLWKDGIHLIEEGTTILANNFIKALNNVNLF